MAQSEHKVKKMQQVYNKRINYNYALMTYYPQYEIKSNLVIKGLWVIN